MNEAMELDTLTSLNVPNLQGKLHLNTQNDIYTDTRTEDVKVMSICQ